MLNDRDSGDIQFNHFTHINIVVSINCADTAVTFYFIFYHCLKESMHVVVLLLCTSQIE